MSSFTEPLCVQQIDGKYWDTTRPFWFYEDEPDGPGVYVQMGFRTDFASIPRIAWPVIGHPAGEYAQAAVTHDKTYSENAGEQGPDYTPRTRKHCDQIFLKGRVVLGVPWWRRTIMYSSVRAMGWRAWGDRRKTLNPEG